MFKPDSPFLNFPHNLDRRQAFYLDGMRHAFEIIECAFSRLTSDLTALTQDQLKGKRPTSYAQYYLDAWAFVDALDRLVALWQRQPNSNAIPLPWTPSKLKEDMRLFREIRNVSDHLAERADQLISSNTAALGELSWISVLRINPPEMKSCLIRPGFLSLSTKIKMNIPNETMAIRNSCGNVLLKAYKHTANLSEAYEKIRALAEYAELDLRSSFESNCFGSPTGGDLFAICDLDLSPPSTR